MHTQRPLGTILNNEADQYTVMLNQYTVQHSILIHGAVYCSRIRHTAIMTPASLAVYFSATIQTYQQMGHTPVISRIQKLRGTPRHVT